MPQIRLKKSTNQLIVMKLAVVVLVISAFIFLNAVSVNADYLTVQGKQVTVNNNVFSAEKASAFLDVWEFKYTIKDATTIVKLPAGMELKNSNVQPTSTK